MEGANSIEGWQTPTIASLQVWSINLHFPLSFAIWNNSVEVKSEEEKNINKKEGMLLSALTLANALEGCYLKKTKPKPKPNRDRCFILGLFLY